jgi:hypothetical protein
MDNGPAVVLTHALALLTSSPYGTTSYLNSDLRNSGATVETRAGGWTSECPSRSCW